ncbi:hypothetical protein V6S67_06850 [Arthrobacter sp. Soc17.1.1.1]|uniref:hypothetical protein n=1 Tax=Arthrobacter sp. Soc17.1.1.1 TaxID=3121277 RepID=UPI002FE44321
MPARQYAPGSADPADRSATAGHVGSAALPARPVPPGGSGESGSGALPGRGRIKAHGVIVRITIAPVTASPSFAALARLDWNGTQEDVRIIWMGQRRVPGVEAGVALRFEGMLSQVGGVPTVYNPRYEIIGRPEEFE